MSHYSQDVPPGREADCVKVFFMIEFYSLKDA